MKQTTVTWLQQAAVRALLQQQQKTKTLNSDDRKVCKMSDLVAQMLPPDWKHVVESYDVVDGGTCVCTTVSDKTVTVPELILGYTGVYLVLGLGLSYR